MAKQYLSADDFFKGIQGETEDFPVEGLGLVQVRSLTTAEVARIRGKAGGDEIAMTVWSLRFGLLQPELSDGDFERLMESKPGPLTAIAQRIMQLSGMLSEDEALENLPGAGS